MQEQIAILFCFNQEYLRQSLAQIQEDQLWQAPAPGIHPSGWILGHLAISFDFARNLLGLPRACPAAWRVLFGPGSSDAVPELRRPTLAELREALDAGCRDVLAALPTADLTALAQPHAVPFEILKQTLPTNRDLLAHLLTTHLATHLGQLSMCRRAWGTAKFF